MINPRPKILDHLASLDYAVFEDGDWNLNIIGVRRSNGEANKYDDTIVVCYKKNGLWQEERFAITTDPGLYWLHHPMNVKGTAVLCPGQHSSSWAIGKHRGKYEALVQSKPVKVFRDSNKDDIIDMDPNTVREGLYGINIHRSGRGRQEMVNKYSAGCQVFSDFHDFNAFMFLCEKQVDERGWKTFTYTLLTEPEDASL